MHDGNAIRTNNKYADIYASSVSSRKPQMASLVWIIHRLKMSVRFQLWGGAGLYHRSLWHGISSSPLLLFYFLFTY